jgi:hypothetical protein
MHAWFGSKQQQLSYVRKFGLQFYSNEKHFSRPDDIPFGDVMVVTTLRHPIGRLFSMSKGGFTAMANKTLNASRSRASDILDRWYLSADVAQNHTNRNLEESTSSFANRISIGIGHFSKKVDNLFQKRSSLLSKRDRAQIGSSTSTRLTRKKENITAEQRFENYLKAQYTNLDIGYFASMRYEPVAKKNFLFCDNVSADDKLGEQMITMAKLKAELIKKNDAKALKKLQKRKPTKKVKNPCNMTLFHLHRNYDRSDLELSISMLEKFSYVAIFEVMDIMTPLFTKKLLGWNQSDINSHRSGSRGTSDEGMSTIAPFPRLIDLAIVSTDYSLELYRYGTKLACYHYYQIVSKEPPVMEDFLDV